MVKHFYIELSDYKQLLKNKADKIPITISIAKYHKFLDMVVRILYVSFLDSVRLTLETDSVFTVTIEESIRKHLSYIPDGQYLLDWLMDAVGTYLLDDYIKIESQVVTDTLTIDKVSINADISSSYTCRYIILSVEYGHT